MPAVSDDQLKFSKKYEFSLVGGIFTGRQGYFAYGKNEINQTAVPRKQQLSNAIAIISRPFRFVKEAFYLVAARIFLS